MFRPALPLVFVFLSATAAPSLASAVVPMPVLAPPTSAEQRSLAKPTPTPRPVSEEGAPKGTSDWSLPLEESPPAKVPAPPPVTPASPAAKRGAEAPKAPATPPPAPPAAPAQPPAAPVLPPPSISPAEPATPPGPPPVPGQVI